MVIHNKYYKEKDTISLFREGTPIVHSKKTWYGRVPSSTHFISSVSVTCISCLGLSDIQIFSLTVLISDIVSIKPFVFTFTANISHLSLFSFNLFTVSLLGMFVCLLKPPVCPATEALTCLNPAYFVQMCFLFCWHFYLAHPFVEQS